MNALTLGILQDAISDVGHWRWWIRKEDVCVVEFGGTQLYAYNPKREAAQSSVVSLQFIGSCGMVFYNRVDIEMKENWHELLQNDQIEPFSIEHNRFAFNDRELAEEIKNTYKNTIIIAEQGPSCGSDIVLSFAAGQVAALVSGATMKVMTHAGELDEVQIQECYDEWWDYWEAYWEAKNTTKPFDEDYACEVTIPAGKG